MELNLKKLNKTPRLTLETLDELHYLKKKWSGYSGANKAPIVQPLAEGEVFYRFEMTDDPARPLNIDEVILVLIRFYWDEMSRRGTHEAIEGEATHAIREFRILKYMRSRKCRADIRNLPRKSRAGR